MPLMVGDDTIETRKTGVSGRPTPPETPVHAGEPAEPVACGCDTCEDSPRDEMWSRWA